MSHISNESNDFLEDGNHGVFAAGKMDSWPIANATAAASLKISPRVSSFPHRSIRLMRTVRNLFANLFLVLCSRMVRLMGRTRKLSIITRAPRITGRENYLHLTRHVTRRPFVIVPTIVVVYCSVILVFLYCCSDNKYFIYSFRTLNLLIFYLIYSSVNLDNIDVRRSRS